MGLLKKITGFFTSKKRKNLNIAMQTFQELMRPELKKPILQNPIHSDEVFYLDHTKLKKPSIDEFFVSPSEIVEQYYGDLNVFSKREIENSIAIDQQRIYGKLTDYDLRAMEYRKRTKNMSELEKRKYRSQILSKSDYLKAA